MIWIKTSRTCHLETLLTYRAMYLLTLHLSDFVDFPLMLQFNNNKIRPSIGGKSVDWIHSDLDKDQQNVPLGNTVNI